MLDGVMFTSAAGGAGACQSVEGGLDVECCWTLSVEGGLDVQMSGNQVHIGGRWGLSRFMKVLVGATS